MCRLRARALKCTFAVILNVCATWFIVPKEQINGVSKLASQKNIRNERGSKWERETVESIYDVISNCNCYFIPFWRLDNGRAMSKTSSKHAIIHDRMSHCMTGPWILCTLLLPDINTHAYAHARTHETFSSEDQMNNSKNVSKFTRNQCQLIALYSILYVVRSPAFFGQIYWPSSRSHMQRCFNSRLISRGYSCCCVTVITIVTIGL